MGSKHDSLLKAKDAKNDEFYTQEKDIASEVIYYKEQLKNKIIYCCCDDPEWSNFYLYFKKMFNFYGLKELWSTYYTVGGQSYYTIFNGEKEIKTLLNGDGDFHSDEVKDIMSKADIIITNPPFSLFRDFIDVLIEQNKDFLVIGNINAVSTVGIFPKIKEGKIQVGVRQANVGMTFIYPKEKIIKEEIDLAKHKTNINGDLLLPLGMIIWYTTLEKPKNTKRCIHPRAIYRPEKYPKYDNYDAINVDFVREIPADYDGKIGVPISYIGVWNPEDYELIEVLFPYINGKKKYIRLIIQKVK